VAERRHGATRPVAGRRVDRRQLAGEAVRRLWNRLVSFDVQDQAAALAFRFFLGLFPFFIFVAALGGVLARLLHVRSPVEQLLALLGDVPTHLTALVREELQAIAGTQQPGLLSFAVLATLGVAVHGMNALIRAMDRAYRVPETRPAWERLLLAVGLTLLAGGVLVGGAALLLLGEALAGWLAGALGLQVPLAVVARVAGLLRWALLPVLMLLAMAFFYRAAPNMPLGWRSVLPGAALFTAGWFLSTFAFSYYVTSFGAYSATYGALASGAVLLVWLYASAVLLLLGAELNAFLDERLNAARVRRERLRQWRAHRARRQAALERRLAPLARLRAWRFLPSRLARGWLRRPRPAPAPRPAPGPRARPRSARPPTRRPQAPDAAEAAEAA
jgi:membrane protein